MFNLNINQRSNFQNFEDGQRKRKRTKSSNGILFNQFKLDHASSLMEQWISNLTHEKCQVCFKNDAIKHSRGESIDESKT